MNDATLQVDHSTLKTAERIARERDCSVEEVIRDAVSEYAGTHVNGTPSAVPFVPIEPESELALNIPMPMTSRPVTIHIVNRSTLGPKPILSDK